MKQKIFIVFASIILLVFLEFVISFLDVKLELKPSLEIETSRIISKKTLDFPNNLYGIHMINNPKKLQKNYPKFKNFEIDVFFIDGNFYVAHDKEDISGLTFSDMLSSADFSNSFIWIDYKNEQHEAAEAVKKLSEILSENGFDKKKIVVEGRSGLIKAFAEEGFYTAYTPPFSKKMTTEERREVIKKTEKIISETGVSALEGNVWQYPMLRDYFPDMDKIIHFARPYVPVRKILFAKQILNDPRVKFFVAEDK